jgi:RNase P subunit RPR2
LKLRAANYEIENINKLLQLSEERVVAMEEEMVRLTTRPHDREEEKERLSLAVQELNQKLYECERQVQNGHQKIVLLKKKVSAYKEINCLTCGENFYHSLQKLRVKLTEAEEREGNGGGGRREGERGEGPRGSGEREGWVMEDRALSEDILRPSSSPRREEITRIGVNGVRKLRVQSATERGRKAAGKKTPPRTTRHSPHSRRTYRSPSSSPARYSRSGRRSQSATRRRSPHAAY